MRFSNYPLDYRLADVPESGPQCFALRRLGWLTKVAIVVVLTAHASQFSGGGTVDCRSSSLLLKNMNRFLRLHNIPWTWTQYIVSHHH